MANTIKHKRGSGSNPSASDLVAGEIAIRTDTGVLFVKKDDDSVASISGGSTDLGVSTTSSAVTVTSSTGNNATISEASGSAAGVMSTAHHDKLDGIEANATADQSASEILTALKTVDGAGSGLDADLLDGNSSGSYLRSDAADTKSSGDLTFSDNVKAVFGAGSDLQIYHDGTTNRVRFNGVTVFEKTDSEDMATFTPDGAVALFHNGSSKFATSSSGISVTGNVVVSGTVDGRDVASDGSKLDGIESGATADQSASEILTLIKTVDGSGSGLDADALDGLSSAAFIRSDTADSASGDISFNGGAGAATIGENSDIRFVNGNWTGNSTKIQHHSNYLYIQGGSSGIIFRRTDGNNSAQFNSSGHFVPWADDTYDLGTSSTQWRNAYFDGTVNADALDVDGATDISGNVTLSGTGTIKVPVGTTAQRPTAATGMIRFNTTRGCFEGYNGSNWVNMSPLNIDDVGAT